MSNMNTLVLNSTNNDLLNIPWEKRIGKKIDLIGQRFGRLVVVKEAEPHTTKGGRKIYRWECVCDCGNTCVVATSDLRNNHTLSCGCYQKERVSKINSIHGLSNTRLYNIHKNMMRRCYDVNDEKYKYYGGRGITMCNEWLGKNGVANFIDWAIQNGYEEDLTIDRIDGNKGYEPDNCRWVTRKQQSNNIRSNRTLMYHGKEYTLSELSQYTGINYSTLNNRINTAKMSVEDAVETPLDLTKRRCKKG